MDTKKAFGMSLKVVRKYRNLSQEDFSIVSSRTYLSTLERGLKSPTLDKIDLLSERLAVHPLTLITLTYLCHRNEADPINLLNFVREEIESIIAESHKAK